MLADQFGLADVAHRARPLRLLRRPTCAGARAAYEAEAPVRVLFESGVGRERAGRAGRHVRARRSTSWPPAEAEAATWYLGADGTLTPAEPGRADAARRRRRVPLRPRGRRPPTLFGGTGDYPLLDPAVERTDWTRFDPGEELSYLTEPFAEDTVFAGPGYADLFVAVRRRPTCTCRCRCRRCAPTAPST